MQLHLCKMTTFLAFRKTAHSLSSGRSGRRTDTTGDVMTDALTTISWDDFRLIKAIADARGLPGAAAQTGLNHSTVFRRLGQIETALGSALRSEEHTSELQSLMRISYAVFCLKKKNQTTT